MKEENIINLIIDVLINRPQNQTISQIISKISKNRY